MSTSDGQDKRRKERALRIGSIDRAHAVVAASSLILFVEDLGLARDLRRGRQALV